MGPQYAVEASEYLFEVTGDEAQVGPLFMQAVGLVVNVESMAALTALRRLAPGLTLSPASGDDLAQRLGLRHYPVLITSTGVEQ